MTWLRLVRAELRKLTTTKMPWGFLAVLLVVSGTTATAVIIGTDMDGSKDFIATGADQMSLMAFGANALMIAGLFGAIAAAREYAHGTVVPTFLSAPRRYRAALAQLTAVLLGGGLLGLVGAALTAAAVAISVPMVDYNFMVSGAGVAQVLVASAFCGAVGAVLGAGAGMAVRNTGGAVTAAVLLLFLVPPVAVQLVNEAATWVPSTLANALSGVGGEPGLPAALAVLAAWGLAPAVIGLIAVHRRDVV